MGWIVQQYNTDKPIDHLEETDFCGYGYPFTYQRCSCELFLSSLIVAETKQIVEGYKKVSLECCCCIAKFLVNLHVSSTLSS